MGKNIAFLLFLMCFAFEVLAQRTVFDNDRGNYYIYPYQFDFSVYGAYGGAPTQTNNSGTNGIFNKMHKASIKSPHARFQHFEPEDTLIVVFPYVLFDAWSDWEQEQGRTGLWVTKTIDDVAYRVGFSYSESISPDWQIKTVVNFADPRFMKFFANEFCRSVLHGKIIFGTPQNEAFGPHWKNLYVGIDNYDWNYSLYGYFEDPFEFIEYGTGFTWDEPFPQNQQELLEAVMSFQSQLNAYAPDCPIIFNGNGVRDTTMYDALFEHTAGTFYEGFLNYFDQGYWDRLRNYWQFQRAGWMAENDKIMIFQGNLYDSTHEDDPDFEDIVKTMYSAYLIAQGQNSFFGMCRNTEDVFNDWEIHPENYRYMKDVLGHPIAPFSAEFEDNDIAYGLYRREYQGGWVFLNLMGVEQEIALNGTFYNRDGQAITSLVLPDFRGDIVTHSPENRLPMVMINNRYAEPVYGEVSVVITCEETESDIRYTLDGSEPDINSPLYSDTLVLTEPTTVKAKAFKESFAPSFVNTAVYEITPHLPEINFHLTHDTINEFLPNGFALVGLNYMSSDTISVDFTVSGSAVFGEDHFLGSGTFAIPPFEKYRFIRIPLAGNANDSIPKKVRIELSSATHASIGNQNVFELFIGTALPDDDDDNGDNDDNDDVGVDNKLNMQAILYPNPANDIVRISGAAVQKIEIFDFQGRKLKEINPMNPYFSVKDFPPGLYVVQIQTHDHEIVVKKLIKQ